MSDFKIDQVYPPDLTVMEIWGFVQKVKDFNNVPDKLAFALEASWLAGRGVNTIRKGGGLPFFGSGNAVYDANASVAQLCAEADLMIQQHVSAVTAGPQPVGIDPSLILVIVQIISQLFGGGNGLLDWILNLFK